MPKKNSRQKSFEKINTILDDTDTNYTDKNVMDKIVVKKNKSNKHKTTNRKHPYKINKTPILRLDYLRKLTLLRIRGKDTATYCHGDELKNANSRSDFSIFRGLSSFKFVKLDKIRSSKHKNYKQITFELTKYGKKYVDECLPKYKQIYRTIRSYIITDFIATITSLIAILISFVFFAIQSEAGLITFSIIDATCLLVLFLSDSNNIFGHLMRKKLVKKDNLTRDKFNSYLSNNHIKEPSIEFNYDDDMPLINSVIFKTPRLTFSQQIKCNIHHFLK